MDASSSARCAASASSAPASRWRRHCGQHTDTDTGTRSIITPLAHTPLLTSPPCSSIILGVRIGKILIQRDESVADKPAHFFYAKLPTGIEEASILLLDPMLASGGSAICAIRHLLSRGVALERITFVCLIAAPEGLDTLLAAFPSLSVVSGILDTRIDERKYILPGVGDFGDRYFGTVENVVEHTEGPKA